MARAHAAVTLEEQGWALRLLGSGGEPPPPVPLRQKPPPDPAAVLVRELGDMPSPGPLDLAVSLGSPSTARRKSPAAAAASGGSGAREGAAVVPAPGSSPAGLQDQQPAAEHAAEEAPIRPAAAAAGAPAGALPGAAALPPALPAVQAASERGGGHSSRGLTAEAFANAPVAAALVTTHLRHRQGMEGAAGSGSLDDVSPLPSPTCTAAAAAGGGGKPACGAAGSGGGGGDGGGGDDGSPPPGLASGREGRSSMDDDEEEDDADEAQQQQQFDTQCALCDDGGNLLACDGPCMRSFHIGKGTECNLLGLPADLAELLATTSDTFRCPNCLAGVQQCFICKKEGEENKDVFKCIHASCGRHYHPKCAEVEPGSPFACKLHTCKSCGKPGERGSKDGELVPCRRCPQAWHRRCLPTNLPHARDSSIDARVWLADYDEDQEKWLDGVETSLLYCKKHPMDPETRQAKFVRRLRKPAERGGQVHEVPYLLIRDDLSRAFLLHYARQYRHLASSRLRLAEEAESAKRPRAVPPAGEESASEEDVPLATKRRRLIKAGEAKKAARPQAAAPAAPAGEAEQAPRQRLPADAAAEGAAGAAPAAPFVIPRTQQAAQPEGKGQAEAGERSESSAATEDILATAFMGEEEVQQAAPAAAHAAAVQRSAAVDAQRLEAALEELVHLPSRHRRAERRKRLLQAAEDDQRLTKDSLRMATRRPEPYRHPMKKTIDESRLQALERSVGYAVDAFRSRRLSEGELMQVLDAGTVRAALAHYDDLLMVLAPYLHGERYSSYGRHFTSHKLLDDVAERLLPFLRTGDQVVDFSCGENYFMPRLKQLCQQNQMTVTGRAYDIILAKDPTDFVLKSWFDAQPWTEGLAPPHRLVIGLNPPFGKNNSLADRFVRKAADFQPRLMVLIVPPRTIIPPAYRVVLENKMMCGGEEFYVPGSTHKSWNKEWPVLRIMERQEAMGMPGVHGELLNCSAALHMHQPVGAGAYPQAGFAAGYGAPAGPDVYGAYSYAHHAPHMLQPPYDPAYGRQLSGRDWHQPQQPPYPPPAPPSVRAPQGTAGRGRQHYGGRGPGQYGGRGRGRGRR